MPLSTTQWRLLPSLAGRWTMRLLLVAVAVAVGSFLLWEILGATNQRCGGSRYDCTILTELLEVGLGVLAVAGLAALASFIVLWRHRLRRRQYRRTVEERLVQIGERAPLATSDRQRKLDEILSAEFPAERFLTRAGLCGVWGGFLLLGAGVLGVMAAMHLDYEAEFRDWQTPEMRTREAKFAEDTHRLAAIEAAIALTALGGAFNLLRTARRLGQGQRTAGLEQVRTFLAEFSEPAR